MMGAPAYPVELMLKLWLMAMIDGVRSSRRLDELTHVNVIYMYLARPTLISGLGFRRENKELIEECLKRVVKLGIELGIVKLRSLVVDGTKIGANASRMVALRRDEVDFVSS